MNELNTRICEMVKQIPDNTNVKKAGKEMIISSSAILNSPGIILSPSYYNHETQRNAIVEKVKNSKDPITDILNIIKNKEINDIKINPEVITYLQSIVSTINLN